MGLTENIMYGQLAPLGTGSFDLLLDVNVNEKQVYIPDNEIHIDIRDNVHIIEDQENNLIVNTPDILNLQSQTPIQARTPNIYESVHNPHNNNSSIINHMGQFTPQTPGPDSKPNLYNNFPLNKYDQPLLHSNQHL